MESQTRRPHRTQTTREGPTPARQKLRYRQHEPGDASPTTPSAGTSEASTTASGRETAKRSTTLGKGASSGSTDLRERALSHRGGRGAAHGGDAEKAKLSPLCAQLTTEPEPAEAERQNGRRAQPETRGPGDPETRRPADPETTPPLRPEPGTALSALPRASGTRNHTLGSPLSDAPEVTRMHACRGGTPPASSAAGGPAILGVSSVDLSLQPPASTWPPPGPPPVIVLLCPNPPLLKGSQSYWPGPTLCLIVTRPHYTERARSEFLGIRMSSYLSGGCD